MSKSLNVNHNRIGYIEKYDRELNPQLEYEFKFIEAPFTRIINGTGDKIRSKILKCSFSYEEIVENANTIKNGMIVIREPFLLDNELRKKVIRWVEWANQADPIEYDPFAKKEEIE